MKRFLRTALILCSLGLSCSVNQLSPKDDDYDPLKKLRDKILESFCQFSDAQFQIDTNNDGQQITMNFSEYDRNDISIRIEGSNSGNPTLCVSSIKREKEPTKGTQKQELINESTYSFSLDPSLYDIKSVRAVWQGSNLIITIPALPSDEAYIEFSIAPPNDDK